MGRGKEYRGDGFSVRIEQGFREIVFLIISRAGNTRKLEGEWIGKSWNGIGIILAQDTDPAEVPGIVRDVETGLGALHVGYRISRMVAVDAVPEAEQQAALTELEDMGFEVERSTDLRQISTTWKPGAKRPESSKAAKEFALRMQKLISTLSGSRPRIEVLARSKEFAMD